MAAHITGAVLNVAAVVGALGFVVANIHLARRGWWLVALAMAIAVFVADFLSGVMHWAFDTWFDERSPARQMVILVRKHHVHPSRIFRYRFRDHVVMLSWFAIAAAGPPMAMATVPDGTPDALRVAAVVGGVTLSLLIVLMFEFHKLGHRVSRSRLVRLLQRLHLLLSPRHHLRHHSGAHDRNYCLINGLADDALGRLGAFRLMEWVVHALTGANPRANDREWLARAWHAQPAEPA